MTPFLAAQVADPNDPSAMLIWADHLEEAGDHAGAASLRGLAGAGIASVHQLSLAAAEQEHRDGFRHAGLPAWAGCGGGDGFQVSSRNCTGKGFGDGELHADSSGLGEGRSEEDETRTVIRLGPHGAHFGGLGGGESFGSRFDGRGEG